MRKAAREGASDWNPNFERNQSRAASKKGGGEQLRRRQSVSNLANKHQHLEQGAPHGPPSRAQWDFVKQRLAWLTPRAKDPAKLARETFHAALHLLVCEEVESLHELQREHDLSRGGLGSAPSSPSHGSGFNGLIDLSESDCSFDAIRALVTGLQEIGTAGRFLQNLVVMLNEEEKTYFNNLLEAAARRKKMTVGLNVNKSLLGVKVDALDADEKVMLLQSLSSGMAPRERQQMVRMVRAFESTSSKSHAKEVGIFDPPLPYPDCEQQMTQAVCWCVCFAG
jgi:hypothetical protein